jgi:hypothetical protein
MPYQFATENQDYSDFSSGRFFYAAPGHAAFPVRLSSEIFQRCLALREKQGLGDPVTIYDPCCGSAYHLSSLAYLHWLDIENILGSDIDPEILPVAARNLSLLTPEGLEKRAHEIAELQQRYGKTSHAEAAASLDKFKHLLEEAYPAKPIRTRLFQADATDPEQMLTGLAGQKIDLVLADIPYGQLSHWQSPSVEINAENFLGAMLEALLAVLSKASIVAIMSNKAQKWTPPHYRRLGRLQVGKRLVMLWQPE